MFNLTTIKDVVISKTSRALLVAEKHAPTAMVIVGTVGLVYSTVKFCEARSRADELLEESNKKIERVHNAHDSYEPEEYSEEDYRKDLALVHAQKIVQVAKIYGPSIILGTLSVACIFGSHYIMRKRNVALLAAYKVLDEGYKKYRDRVVEEFGAEKDADFQYGRKHETVTETIEQDGKKVKVKKDIITYSGDGTSVYAQLFTDDNAAWRGNRDYNLFFISAQETYLNQVLHSRGHVFLNEAYDALCLPRTKAGCVVGWVDGEEGKDRAVDFGVFDHDRNVLPGRINDDGSIIIDFNVDGAIWDLI